VDREHEERKKRLREEETDMLGSARMVTLKGQPDPDVYEEIADSESKKKKGE